MRIIIDAKYIALSQAIHHLTRSKHFIVILNKFGHCISYKVLQILDIEEKKSIVCEDKDRKVLILKNIFRDSSSFLDGALEKNDFSEEILNGKDSTHVTAMLIYQEIKPLRIM